MTTWIVGVGWDTENNLVWSQIDATTDMPRRRWRVLLDLLRQQAACEWRQDHDPWYPLRFRTAHGTRDDADRVLGGLLRRAYTPLAIDAPQPHATDPKEAA